jgi:hypothetical protein
MIADELQQTDTHQLPSTTHHADIAGLMYVSALKRRTPTGGTVSAGSRAG